MLYNGGKPKKLYKKRHFTVVIGNKEQGLYISSTPSSAARKVVTKLCESNKSKKVEFYIREITRDSKKKTYGPYIGQIEKLKEPIELEGRTIKYKSIAKLKRKKMIGGENVSHIDDLYNHQLSFTYNIISQNKYEKLPAIFPFKNKFKYKTYYKRIPAKSFQNTEKMKYIVSFETKEGLNSFKKYV
jgi:hypothetical protein